MPAQHQPAIRVNAGRGESALIPIAGFKVGAIASSIRYTDRLDFAVIATEALATAHCATTQTSWPSAPVVLVRQAIQEVSGAQPWLFYVNSGIANAATGKAGIVHQQQISDCLAQKYCILKNCQAVAVLPFATGVIGPFLPVDKMCSEADSLLKAAGTSAQHWHDFSQAVRTTDTFAKTASKTVLTSQGPVSMTGMAKGAAMVAPNMATMLAFICTDLAASSEMLRSLNTNLVTETFNKISIDTDTSTSDCVLLAASGASKVDFESLDTNDQTAYQDGLYEIYDELSQAIIQDAEGINKMMLVLVKGAANRADADSVARAIVDSPLWKTALSVGDPNWGRLVMAIGKSGIALVPEQIDVDINGMAIMRNGQVASSYTEHKGQNALQSAAVEVTVNLGQGACYSHCYGSDLTAEYVALNADYRT